MQGSIFSVDQNRWNSAIPFLRKQVAESCWDENRCLHYLPEVNGKPVQSREKKGGQQRCADILAHAEWYFIAWSWMRLQTVQDALVHPGTKPKPQVTCDCVSSSL